MSVEFFTVRAVEEKLALLCQIVEEVFHSRRRLLLCVENGAAAEYVDALLWQTPPSSFLPHSRSNLPCNDPLAITEGFQNVNKAEVIINLSPTACPLARQGIGLIEFDDRTTERRAAASRQKRLAYANWGIEVIATKEAVSVSFPPLV